MTSTVATAHAAPAFFACVSRLPAGRVGLTPGGFPPRYRPRRGPEWARAVFRDPRFCLAGASAQNLSVPEKSGTEEGAILSHFLLERGRE